MMIPIFDPDMYPTSVFCSGCPFNDGMIYTSNPPVYKCTRDGKWHPGTYGCGKVYIRKEYVYMGEEKDL